MSRLDELVRARLAPAVAGKLQRLEDGSFSMPIMFGPYRLLWFSDPAEARQLASAALIVAQALEAEEQAAIVGPLEPPAPAPADSAASPT